MSRHAAADIARLELLLKQTMAQIAYIKRYHPSFIELREHGEGPKRSQDRKSPALEELERLCKEPERHGVA